MHVRWFGNYYQIRHLLRGLRGYIQIHRHFEQRIRRAYGGELNGELNRWHDEIMFVDADKAVREIAEDQSPSVVGIGPNVPVETALSMARSFEEHHPEIAVIVIAEPSPELWEQALRAGVVIDTTGDGDVAARAGAPYEKGRTGDGLLQPVSLFFRVGNVDDQAVQAYMDEHPEDDVSSLMTSEVTEDVTGIFYYTDYGHYDFFDKTWEKRYESLKKRLLYISLHQRRKKNQLNLLKKRQERFLCLL